MAVYYSLQASLLSQTDTPLNALSAYVALENYLPAKEQADNHTTIWSLLLAQATPPQRGGAVSLQQQHRRLWR